VASVTASSLFSSGTGASNWLADAWTAIQNDTSSTAGLMGMLASSNSSSSTILDNAATNFATIAQSSTTSSSAFYAQIAAQHDKERQQAAVQKALKSLQDSQQAVQPKNVLSPNIYFEDGSYLDTENNIMTMSDGTQYDTTTGLKYIDPQYLIQLGNGAYVDTKNNVMTMADGTQIDTVTGLKKSQIVTTTTTSTTSSTDSSNETTA
jgi:hypothetical protein